jgi:trans-AT polyketide synthase/acyltransferase/oxidoreductase domain-containing protein
MRCPSAGMVLGCTASRGATGSGAGGGGWAAALGLSASGAVVRGASSAAASRGSGPAILGQWLPGTEPAAFEEEALLALLPRVREALHVVWSPERRSLGLAPGGTTRPEPDAPAGPAAPEAGCPLPWIATLPPLYPEWLGDPAFRAAHGVRFGYVAGEMAGGIATADLVTAMARARLLGFFGAAGLPPDRVEREIDAIEHALAGRPAAWGSNLIHNPADPAAEEAMVDLYLRRGVRRVSASAFMDLRPSVVRLAATGLRLDPGGQLERRHHIMAKVSRPEVAAQFASPAPRALLESLVAAGSLSRQEADLASRVPVAEDVTVEADSGGHTDNRPLTVLLPAIRRVCEDVAARYGYARPVRVGAAGGLGTPEAVAAAFAMGAAYVLTGSINQVAPAGRGGAG